MFTINWMMNNVPCWRCIHTHTPLAWVYAFSVIHFVNPMLKSKYSSKKFIHIIIMNSIYRWNDCSVLLYPLLKRRLHTLRQCKRFKWWFLWWLQKMLLCTKQNVGICKRRLRLNHFFSRWYWDCDAFTIFFVWFLRINKSLLRIHNKQPDFSLQMSS